MTEYNDFFSYESLVEIFDDRVRDTRTRGVDGMSPKSFSSDRKSRLGNASVRCLAGAYSFTNYKLKLVSKGPKKPPREICIPTVRDRVVLRALCDYLVDFTMDEMPSLLPQKMIRKISDDIASGSYGKFVKLDVQDFYPSIKHDLLLGHLKTLGADSRAVALVEAAISTPWSSKDYLFPSERAEKGVPQGLSISNILSSIYMLYLDKVARGLFNAKYYRYVDDILIFKKHGVGPSVESRVYGILGDLSLDVHSPSKAGGKSKEGRLSYDDFGYLGYLFLPEKVTVRNASVSGLRDSLVGLFVSYRNSKNKNVHYLQWRVNLRITGCIFENRKKGWLFFFSEIDDLSLLYSLDAFVDSLCKRFGVSMDFKRFVRSYYEVKHSRYSDSYIPDFDQIKVDEMRRIITVCWRRDPSSLSADELTMYFKKRLRNEVRDLQTDLKFLGSPS